MLSIASNSFHDIFTLILCLLTTALALAFGHYFPWHELLGKELPRFWAYVYGTVWVYLPIAFLFLLEGQVRVVYIIAASIFTAGLADGLCYSFDAWRNNRKARLQAEADRRAALEREAQLRKDLKTGETGETGD